MRPTLVADRQDENSRYSLPSRLANLGRQALIAEAELTPKPGLVDRRGSGSHADLNLSLMRSSANAIAPYFAQMARLAETELREEALRVAIAAVGRSAESAMMKVTHGSNAHRGAIWVLGLLVTGSARQPRNVASVVTCASRLARLPDIAQPRPVSHGDLARARHGLIGGAREEAMAGFPHVTQVGLPALQQARGEGRSETDSRLYALFTIMASLADTCLIYRGGLEGLEFCRDGAARVLADGGPGSREGNREIMLLDAEMVKRKLSPGGSADLFSAVLFLDAFERGCTTIQTD